MTNKKIQIGLKFKNKNLKLQAKKCDFIERFLGLMFTKRENAEILLFDFQKNSREPIHSFFVFYPFIAVWTDDKKRILEWKIVKPFKLIIRPKKPFRNLIEIPLNHKYSKEIKFLYSQLR